MKKALIACLAIAAVFAFANSASAVTCTLDQHPAATLLVPYFQVTVGPNGNPIGGTALARDTIITIANASSAPMIAHVNVYDRYSSLQLDFNVALTGFDVQAWRMSDILSGNLPITVNADGDDACQSNPNANVYPDPDGFLRVRPLSPATPLDNTAGITKYGSPAFSFPLGLTLATECDGTVDPVAIGYIVIDHANYCNLSDPTDPNYYFHNAIGMENNLFGEIIFTSGNGLPTYGISTVNMEADTIMGEAALIASDSDELARTFYARYWENGGPYPSNCPNCGSGNPATDLSLSAPWDIPLLGDQREPLGLRYALRWFDLTSTGVLTTNFMVWRGSRVDQGDAEFCEPGGEVDELPVTVTFFDEDENTVSSSGCPSPCTSPQFNFEHETNLKNITSFQHPTSGSAGWVEMNFVNNSGDVLDQAWGAYSFEGSVALESVLIPGTALDPNACDPLGIDPTSIILIPPVTPSLPTGCGPSGGCDVGIVDEASTLKKAHFTK
jgi:hypothetical protein